MHDRPTGLSVDADAVGRLSADLAELALRWMTSASPPDPTPSAFGTDAQGIELSGALPVFLARVLEGRRRCCTLLEAASTALGRAAGAFDERAYQQGVGDGGHRGGPR